MAEEIEGARVAMVVENGFEQVELREPKKALEGAGATVDVISPHPDKVKGWNFTDWGDEVKVDVVLGEADAYAYDALVLPGGVMNPDRLRRNPDAWRFIGGFFAQGKPVAAICHGPWTLIDAGLVDGRQITSWPSLQVDLKNAGAHWVDQEVVQDRGLTTSRGPRDIPAFNRAVIEEIRRYLASARRAAA